MELSTIKFPDFVKLGEVLWLKGADSVKNSMMDSGFVATINIDENSGSTREFSEIDTNEYLSYKAEGDQASRGKYQQGYTKTMTKYRVAENTGITYEMRKENKYNDVVSELMAAGRKGYNTIDLDLSHRITFATSTSYTDRNGRTIDTTTGDGYQLAYSAHTLKGSSTTFRNILANNPKISKGSLEAMERMIVENTYSHLGEKKTIEYDIVWTTDDPNSVNTAREYLLSTSDVEGAHSGIINVYNNKYRLVILPRVATDKDGNTDTTKRYYWGLASSFQQPIKLGMWEAPHMDAPSAGSNGDDIQTDDWEFRTRAGYGICTPGPKGFTISLGDGSN